MFDIKALGTGRNFLGKVGVGIKEKVGQAIQALESGVQLSDENRCSIVDTLKQSEQEVTKIRRWMQSAELLADIGIWEIDHQKDEIFWSDQMYRILGYEPEQHEPSYKSYLRQMSPQEQERVHLNFIDSLYNKNSFEITYRIKLPNNQIKYVEARAIHFYNDVGEPFFTIGTSQDVTDWILDKQRLEKSLEENQTLLGEIHHRVKNNLAVVAGLLQLQWLKEDDPELVKTLKEGANRMRAVAGIHKQLYESGDYSSVALGENITKLVTDIVSTMMSEKEINIKSNCDRVYLNIKQTMPCTLIVNELVTNSIKYAFEGKAKGTITVDLTMSDDLVRLEVSDNGVGLPDDFDSERESLGMNLIKTLTNQLNAEYNFRSSEKGTTFSMQFLKEGREE